MTRPKSRAPQAPASSSISKPSLWAAARPSSPLWVVFQRLT